MKCVVANVNLGTWCRAINSLTLVGDEDIYFDFSDTIVTVSTTNSTYSSFATFLFFKPFFTSYRMTSDDPEKAVIPSKLILKPYKTPRMTKNYLSSEINYDPKDDFMTVTSEARSQASVTYKLGTSSNKDDIQLDCDPYALRNYLKADAKVLSSCLANFGHVKGLAEITLKIQGSKVILRNCVTDTARKDGSVVTEYYLSAPDFTEFEFQDDSVELTFGFREFKIFTSFAEHLKLPVCIHFQERENPVVIVVKTDTFEARLVLATRMTDPFTATPSTNGTPLSAGSNGRISAVTSQSSASNNTSRDIASLEVQRQQRDNSARNIPVSSEIVSSGHPPAKRMRRTDAVPPASPSHVSTSQVEPMQIDINNDQMEEDVNFQPAFNIGPLVDRMEKQQKSTAYRSIQKIVGRPSITEDEYLSTVPGHDIVLCPGSDDEDEPARS